jgi:hypothetical protein
MRQRDVVRLVETLLRRTKGKHKPWLIVAIAGAVVAYVLVQPALEKRGISLPGFDSGSRRAAVVETATPGEQAIISAFQARESNVMVEGTATVKKILPDDNVGSRHQKMILRLPSGHTLLLAHNIDLAPRVPADEGDNLDFKGEYEYSEQGGVLHWTHHDPGGRHPAGWLRHEGSTYE